MCKLTLIHDIQYYDEICYMRLCSIAPTVRKNWNKKQKLSQMDEKFHCSGHLAERIKQSNRYGIDNEHGLENVCGFVFGYKYRYGLP